MKRLWLRVVIVVVRIVAIVPLLWLYYFLHFQAEGNGVYLDAAVNAGMLTVWCLFHSLMARERPKRLIASIGGEHAVRAVFVVSSGITFSLVLFLWRPLSGVLWTTHGISYWALTLVYLAAIAGAFYTARFFDGLDFIGVRVYVQELKGKAYRPTKFSASGPYAYCRHPMYLFFLSSMWIGPTMTYGRLEFALIGTAYTVFATFLEERNLAAELGSEYELYKEKVPMWVPRMTPWKQEPTSIMGPSAPQSSAETAP